MSLRTKAVLILLAVFAVYCASEYGMQRFVIVPALLMQIETSRQLKIEEMMIWRYVLLSSAAYGLIFSLIMLPVFWKAVLEPILRLWRRAVEISRSEDPKARFSFKRADEIGTLASRFDRMLDRLEKHSDDLALSNELLLREIDQHTLADNALNEQLHFLQTLIDAIPSPIFITDSKGFYQGCNAAFEGYLGRSRSEIQGKTIFDILPQKLAKRYHEMDLDLFENPGIQVYEASVEYADGKKRDVIVNKATFLSTDGTLSGMVGIMLDISERKRAEETLCRQNEYLAALHETTLGLISRLELGDLLEAIVTRAGALVGTPHGFVYLYNPESQVLEMQLGLGTHSSNVGFCIKPGEGLAGKVWKSGKPMVIENYASWEGRHPDPRFDKNYWMVGVPLKSHSHVAGVLGLSYLKSNKGFSDDEVSILCRFAELASVALENARLYTWLNKELVERKQAEENLREAKEAADAASNAKSEFLARVSHEIRTPMNAILGMTRLTLDTSLTARQRSYQEMVLSSATSLLELLNTILDLSKIEAGRLELETTSFRLPHLLNTLSDTFRARALQKGIDLNITVAPNVPQLLMGDPVRLRQVLESLVGNAVKFTDSGSIKVRVECANASKHTDEVELLFSVKDTGIGIDPNQIEQLFDSFTQGDGSTTRKYGGTGLGLAISKRLVEIMGGQIRVESESGKGSEFFFSARFGTVSALENEGDRNPDIQKLIERVGGSHVLLVEDNFINRQVAKQMLKRAGVTVEMATNGIEAIQALERSRFDAVLMDVRMPGLNGYDATRIIHNDPRFASLPIIALTANAMQGDRERCIEAGMNDYVAKPIEPEDLYETLARWVQPEGGKKGLVLSENSMDAPLDGSSIHLPSAIGKERQTGFIPQLDIEAAVKRIGGSRELLARLLGIFSSNYANISDEVSLALKRHDKESALRLLHGLKGVAGIVSARHLHAITVELEARIRGGKTRGLDALLDDFKNALEEAIEWAGRIEKEIASETADRSEFGKTGSKSPLPPFKKGGNELLLPISEEEKAGFPLTLEAGMSSPSSKEGPGAYRGMFIGEAGDAIRHSGEGRNPGKTLLDAGFHRHDEIKHTLVSGSGEIFDHLPPPEPSATPREDLALLLIELDEFLKNHDLDARPCVELILKSIDVPEILYDVEFLKEQIEEFQFKGARKSLALIAKALGIALEQANE